MVNIFILQVMIRLFKYISIPFLGKNLLLLVRRIKGNNNYFSFINFDKILSIPPLNTQLKSNLLLHPSYLDPSD